jgi:hypothetical protein
MEPDTRQKDQSGPIRYPAKIQPKPPTAFRVAAELIAPGCGCRRLVPLFQGRVPHHRIADWLSGYSPTPQWAIDLLRQHVEQDAAAKIRAIDQIKTGQGSAKAGAYALARWRASRR